MRDLVQLNDEGRQANAVRAHRGLLRSMIFVVVGTVVVLNTGVAHIRIPGAVAFFFGALASGLVFTLLLEHGLGPRLFCASVAGAMVDQVVYGAIRALDAAHPFRLATNSQELFALFMMIVPAILFWPCVGAAKP